MFAKLVVILLLLTVLASLLTAGRRDSLAATAHLRLMRIALVMLGAACVTLLFHLSRSTPT